MMTYIIPFQTTQVSLSVLGGKGLNLARLYQAGFPVPEGFVISTPAYQEFVTVNELQPAIAARLGEAIYQDSEKEQSVDLPANLETVSQQIRALFTIGRLPAGITDAICDAYRWLGRPAVAVRSSATVEDLPELSFAGQQDTYLNVVTEAGLLQAVVNCWSSLWTGRAIGYRQHNHISQADLGLAVVVQKLVDSVASGVMFTANPVTGLRAETVIDATLGLGEALVAGKVQPDHYVVLPGARQIKAKSPGARQVVIRPRPGGGTGEFTSEQTGQLERSGELDRQTPGNFCPEPTLAGNHTPGAETGGTAGQALPDGAILELAHIGQQVQAFFGFPQDIEWAWADGQLYLLQARPITALFPLPEPIPEDRLEVYFSFGAVQGLLDPMTPIGRDAIKILFAAGAGLFGEKVTSQTQKVIYEAGERLWGNFTAMLKNSVGRRVVPVALSMVEPTIKQAVEEILDDPRLQPRKAGVSWRAKGKIARFLLPLVFNVVQNLLAPIRRRKMVIDHGEAILLEMERRCAAIQGVRWQKLTQIAAVFPEMIDRRLKKMLLLFISGVASGMASWNLLNRLANKSAGTDRDAQARMHDLVLEITRGMPYNPTTEMDLHLWEMAKALQQESGVRQVFTRWTASELAQCYHQRQLPALLQERIGGFLEKYGGRGLGEIDLGRTRWAEEPTHVFEMLASYMRLEDPKQAPDVVFGRGAATAQGAIDQIAQAVQKGRHGWIKAHQARFLARRARQLMGMRESPKFFAVRMLWHIQRALIAVGNEFVQAGELVQADDLFYLRFDELDNFAKMANELPEKRSESLAGWQALIQQRRAAYQHEMARKQLPRLILSDGRVFYKGMQGSSDDGLTILGDPVSPGSVEGRVRVVLDPRQAGLLPGEILVCRGTDPSWTPLFLTARGLVMETGGMMTHGAVVAREYGIPAIVGVDQATSRLKTGQAIRLDGSTGKIWLVDSHER